MNLERHVKNISKLNKHEMQLLKSYDNYVFKPHVFQLNWFIKCLEENYVFQLKHNYVEDEGELYVPSNVVFQTTMIPGLIDAMKQQQEDGGNNNNIITTNNNNNNNNNSNYNDDDDGNKYQRNRNNENKHMKKRSIVEDRRNNTTNVNGSSSRKKQRSSSRKKNHRSFSRKNDNEQDENEYIYNNDESSESNNMIIDTQNQPLHNMIICVTGYAGKNRSQIDKLSVKLGAKFTQVLTKKCTHLVCKSSQGEKYLKALKWGHLHIITKEWLEACYEMDAHVDENDFLLDDEDDDEETNDS